MSSVQNDTPTPPPGLSAQHRKAVADARNLCKPSTIIVGNAVEADYLRDLLAAYDVLAARMAWLAAQHAMCQLGGQE